MRLVILLLWLVCAVLPAAERGLVPLRRAAGDHVALVIGNGAYPDVPLSNPVNDAVDVGRAFASIGFQVTVVSDADKAQMLYAIGQFGDRLAKAKAGVFYYAGHGVQVGGTNWLLPVARQVGEIINREDEVRLRAVDANEVLVAMERAKVPVAMVILDACRNNPFKGAGRSGAKGLAQLDAPPGSLVVYATAPGQVAGDGKGRNSPFSQAFVSQLLVPGQEVEAMLRNIKKGVRESTQGVQVPWSSSSMTETFAFVPAMSPDEEAAMKRAELAGLQGQAEAIAKAEATAAAKRQVEETALAAKQAEVDKLNAQIEEMKKRVNSGDTSGAQPVDGDGGGLKAMLAVVRQKEAQQKGLVEMQRKADEARQKREAEIARMKAADAQAARARDQQRLDQLTVDLKDYREIAGSEFGKDMAQSAWEEVLKKWGVAVGGIPLGDEKALAARVAPRACDDPYADLYYQSTEKQATGSVHRAGTIQTRTVLAPPTAQELAEVSARNQQQGATAITMEALDAEQSDRTRRLEMAQASAQRQSSIRALISWGVISCGVVLVGWVLMRLTQKGGR